MAPDPFARPARQSWTTPGRTTSRAPEERVTIACACGTIMTLAWTSGSSLACFGCGKHYEPPPHLTPRSKPVWRPELAFCWEPPRPSLWRRITGFLKRMLGA